MEKLSNSFLRKRFNRLGWRILEEKFCYYEGSKYKIRPIEDEKYDKLEVKYISLSKKLNVSPTASSSVGFPNNTPSGKLVAEKMINSKGKNKTKLLKVKK